MDDPFVLKFNAADRKVAAEFLTDWLPFLSKDLCHSCSRTLSDRIRSIDPGAPVEDCGYTECSHPEEDFASTSSQLHEESHENIDDCDTNSLGSWKDGANGWSEHVTDVSTSGTASERVTINSPNTRMSWADMADELEGDEEEVVNKQSWADECDPVEEVGVGMKVQQKPALPREQREYIRFMNVQRKKDFICLERINGKIVNILDGLELHCNVFSAAEQKRIIDFIYALQEKGKKRELKARTFTAPQKWMRGKGRVTIQFGCCYNYAIDKNGNPPGILQSEVVDPLPNLFKVIIRRLIGWHVLPPSCVPDSCIVNIYEEGDCIPPHIDNLDFVRPFCTVSFLSECNIVFGSNLKIVGAGEFAGAVAIPLPVGSVLVLNGNGADIAKHCVPAVPTKRISITFRKMDQSKLPFSFIPEPDLQGIQPLPYGDESRMSDPLKLYPPPVRQPRGNQNFGRNPHSEPQFSRNRSRPANKRRVRVNLGT